MTKAPTDFMKHLLLIFGSNTTGGAGKRKEELEKRLHSEPIPWRYGSGVELSVLMGNHTKVTTSVPEESPGQGDVWLSQLAGLNTSALLLIMAGVKMAVDNHENLFVADPKAMMWERGRKNLNGDHGKTCKLLTTLTEFRFEMKVHVRPRGWLKVDGPLIVPANITREKCYQDEHPKATCRLPKLFWDLMVEKGRQFWYDPAVLKANTNHDAIAVKLYLWVASQTAVGWAKDGLYTNGGNLTRRLKVITEQAGINLPWATKRRRLRGMMARALDKLQAPTWDGRALIAGWTTEPSACGDPAEDRYGVTLPDELRQKLSEDNARRIQRAEQKRGVEQPDDTGLLNGNEGDNDADKS